MNPYDQEMNYLSYNAYNDPEKKDFFSNTYEKPFRTGMISPSFNPPKSKPKEDPYGVLISKIYSLKLNIK